MPLLEDATLIRAVNNVSTWGDTDVFPFPVENHVLHDRSDQVLDVLRDIALDFEGSLNSTPVTSFSTLAPVGYTGFRWATQIDPVWNAYLLASVLALAPHIESARVAEVDEKVFSYRYRDAPNTSSIFAVDGWRAFQTAARIQTGKHAYVVSADISDFYSRIYHHRLENALSAVDRSGTHTKHIMDVLSKLSNGTSYGLPFGGPAARLLAELLLNRVDHLLLSNHVTHNFCRYADDYRFFVPDLESAYKCIGVLSEKLLRNEGLSLQKSKTRIMTAAEYQSVLDPVEPPTGSAAAFLNLSIHYDPYSSTAEQDYEILQARLEEFDIVALLRSELEKGRIHAALVRRLINALKFMDDSTRQQAILSLLENVDTLAPVFAQVMLTIRDCLPGLPETFIDEVHSRVRNLVDSRHHVAQVDLNLAYIVRVLGSKHSMANETQLVTLYSANHGFTADRSPAIQRDIMLILAKWKVGWWLSDQKNYIAQAHPWLRRAFLVSSYALGDEGKHWRRANRPLMSKFDFVVRDWAASKTANHTWEIPV